MIRVGIAALISIFIVTVAWFTLYQPIHLILEVARDAVAGNSAALGVLLIVENAWNWWPIIAIACTLIVAAVYIQREEGRSSIYG